MPKSCPVLHQKDANSTESINVLCVLLTEPVRNGFCKPQPRPENGRAPTTGLRETGLAAVEKTAETERNMRKGTEKRRVPRLIQWLDEGWLFSLTESVTVLIALVVGMALYWLLCQKLFWPLGSLFHTERGTLGEVLVLMSSMIISSIPLLFLMPFATVFKEEIAGWICGPPIKVWARRQWKATTGAPFAAEEVEKRLGEIARAVQASPPVGDDPQAGFWKAWHAARLMGTGPKRSSFGDYAREGR